MKSTELYDEPLVVAFAADHPFVERDMVTLERIAQEPYLDRLACEFRDTFIAESAARGQTIRFVARSEREDWIQRLVLAGAGVTILPAESVVVDGLMTRPGDAPSVWRTVSLAVPYGREDTAPVRAFLAAAREFDWGAVVGRS